MAVVGVLSALAGILILSGLFAMVYADSDPLRGLALDLGLAGTALVSAAAQIAVLVGLWLLWRAVRTGKTARDAAESLSD